MHYGLENFELNQNETDKICTTEGNLVKSMVNINKQVHTTSLFAALGIEQTRDRLKQEKLQFFIRLYENKFTANILLEIAHANYYNGFQVEICKILNINYTSDTDSLIKQANHAIFFLECKHKDLIKYDDKSGDLKRIFKIKNRDQFLQQMHACIGFTTTKKAPQLNVQNCFQIY